MKSPIAACLLLFAFVLTDCSSFAQPTQILTSTGTLTDVPTRTDSRTSTSTPLPPTETPGTASAWHGIPIMPGAVAGEGDEESYVFTIRATPQQTQEYYELELGKLGWQLSAREEGDASLLLIFINDASATLTVSIITRGDAALVLLVK